MSLEQEAQLARHELALAMSCAASLLPPRPAASPSVRSRLFLSLCGLLKFGQGETPELLEVRLKRGNALGVEAVEAARAGCFVHDEAGLLQHAQVLRDRRPAHR